MALALGRSLCTHSRGRGERPLPGLRTVDDSQKSVLLKKKKMQNQKAGQKKYPNVSGRSRRLLFYRTLPLTERFFCIGRKGKSFTP